MKFLTQVLIFLTFLLLNSGEVFAETTTTFENVDTTTYGTGGRSEDTTGRRGEAWRSNRTGWRFWPMFSNKGGQAASQLEKKILCAFGESGTNASAGSAKQKNRAQYLAKYLSELFSRIEPEWRDLATQHVLAQVVAETGNLKFFTELSSEYKSSNMKFKGRGAMQTTHKGNYARLAGCANAIKNNPPPALIAMNKLAGAPPLPNAPVVKRPEELMSEKKESGKRYNALSAACYMIDTAARHPLLQEALKCSEPRCVQEVGVAVNRGPGKLGKGMRPLNNPARQKAFNAMNKCFNRKQRG